MKLGGKSVALLLLLVALILANYLGSQYSARLDFTQDNIYTLSRGTKQLLGKLEEPLALELYFSRSAEDIPIQFKNYATRVEELLRQFATAANGRIRLSVIDPRPDTDEETAAQRVGLTPRQSRTGVPIFFGLVVTQGAEERTIPFFDYDQEQYLEYNIAKLIYSVQQFDKPRLGLLSSLPLRAQPMMMPQQQPQNDQMVVQEWENTFEVVAVEDSASELPDNLDVLAVINPQNLSDKLQFAIDQFLLAGKPVFVAVDPSSFYLRSIQQRQQNPMMMQPPGNTSSDLPELFAAWGITYDAANVVGDLQTAMRTQGPRGLSTNATWMEVTDSQFNASAQVASSISKMWLIEAGAVSVATDRGYEITPLIETTPRNGTVPAMTLGFTPDAEQLTRQIKPTDQKKTLAVLVHGNFKTAFPEGAPKDPTPETRDDAEGEDHADHADHAAESETPAAPALATSAKPGSLIVIADSDWLLDIVSVRQLAANLYLPTNDNLSFAGNVVDFLGGSEDLIGIRGKGTSQRPFEVIRAMELSAQEKYQAQLEEAEKKLSEVQQELNKIATNQTNERRLVMTAEVEEALKRYRDQEAEMRAEIRGIRRQLREGVEQLEFRITLANLLPVPLLLILVGVAFIVRRNSRQRQG